MLKPAEMYRNHLSLGEAIKQSKVLRNELFVTSKVSFKESAKDIRATLEQQLEEMQLEYVDLYLIHSPLIGDLHDMWKQVSRGFFEILVAKGEF